MNPFRARALPVRSQVLVGLLAVLLGFGFALQIQTTQRGAGLAGAREEDLVRILDELAVRAERLRADISDLSGTRDRLSSGLGQSDAALAESRRRVEALGILAGTVPARGPGVVLTISDPQNSVTAEVLLDTLGELRNAGAEALEVNGVRVVASTAVTERDRGLELDGTPLAAPYRITAVGGASTLAAALDIPGGVVDSVAARPGASAVVSPRNEVVIRALRGIRPARYARPTASREGAP